MVNNKSKKELIIFVLQTLFSTLLKSWNAVTPAGGLGKLRAINIVFRCWAVTLSSYNTDQKYTINNIENRIISLKSKRQIDMYIFIQLSGLIRPLLPAIRQVVLYIVG
jgi:hypothetical protein